MTVKSAQKPKTGGIKEKEQEEGPNLRNYSFDTSNFTKELDTIVEFSQDEIKLTLKSGMQI